MFLMLLKVPEPKNKIFIKESTDVLSSYKVPSLNRIIGASGFIT